MLPQPPEVVKCQRCKKCYWLKKAADMGEEDWFRGEGGQANPGGEAIPFVMEPDENSYYQAIDNGLAVSSKQKRHIRMLAWWRHNDPWRGNMQGRAPGFSAAGRANLEALMQLLDPAGQPDENDRLMKAEILRELGEFAQASQVLAQVTSAQYAEVVRQMQQFCDAKDASVRELRL